MTGVMVGQARVTAAEWVRAHARVLDGYRGAYFSGSTTWLSDDAELSPVSDVDVTVVLAQHEVGPKPGKFRHDGVLLEVSYLPGKELADPERVLSSYHLASSFRTDNLIDDPTGRLRALQTEVACGFTQPEWVRRRCQDARLRVENRLRTVGRAPSWPDQVLGWLFPTGVTTHVLLVAALRNPTVRLRYLAAREVLARYGHDALYPELLRLLGCADLSADRVQHHLDALARTFDATAAVARTPFFFSSDITPEARPIAIDGSQQLVDRGDHREAVFWIVATFARCHNILAADAPDLHRELTPAFRTAVADLGITGPDDLRQRADQVTGFLPRLWQTAEAIIAATARP